MEQKVGEVDAEEGGDGGGADEVRMQPGECPICLFEIDARKQLDCGHAFCRGCIDKWATSKAEKVRVSRSGVRVPCPLCRSKTRVPVPVGRGP